MKEETIQLLNVNPGVGNGRLSKYKFEIYRDAILKAVADCPDGIALKDLFSAVREQLPDDSTHKLGKLRWHVMTVKLHLEAIGMIKRLGSSPQILISGPAQ